MIFDADATTADDLLLLETGVSGAYFVHTYLPTLFVRTYSYGVPHYHGLGKDRSWVCMYNSSYKPTTLDKETSIKTIKNFAGTKTKKKDN